MNLENALVRYKGYDKTMGLVGRDIKLRDGNFINAIVGPRRAGKTSLMLLYMQGLEIPESNKVFISCEDIDFVGITSGEFDNLEAAIYRVYGPSGKYPIYLFIDEVQTFPEWPRWLRTLFDQRKYRLFVTGSTSELSLDALPSALRGRAVNTMVLPFSFKEYLAVRGVGYTKYMGADEKGVLANALTLFIEFGGYPEIARAGDNELRQAMLSELYATVIQRDMIEKYKIRKVTIFKSFINALFGSACRNLSPQTLVRWFGSQGVRISTQTALNYIGYARNAFLFFLVYPYSRKIKERNTKPKLYVSDSGILGLFEQDRGKKLENAVLIELKRRNKSVFYYKSAAADVDFVLTEGNGVGELIQVSYGISDPTTFEREIESLTKAAEDLHCSNLTVVTFDEEKIIKNGGKNIKVVPAWKWLLEGP